MSSKYNYLQLYAYFIESKSVLNKQLYERLIFLDITKQCILKRGSLTYSMNPTINFNFNSKNRNRLHLTNKIVLVLVRFMLSKNDTLICKLLILKLCDNNDNQKGAFD